ncbi:DHHW family protein [Mesobacillus jeotgali]|uniref:DHHW family protein n=1 Tax=Mesobacillus jeotgali TaxID=129985 RepID=UPI0009A71EB9|nr:DHHW family protein [Mesobacillus jeotgali]
MPYKMKDLFIVSVFFGVIFFFGAAALLSNDRASSQLEGRTLAKKPVADPDEMVSGEYFKKYDRYFSDQFPLRDKWIEGNAFIDKNVLAKNYIRGIYINDNGYMITPINPPNNGSSIVNINKTMNSFSADLNRSNVKTYFALVPNKSTMMEKDLPDYIESHANELTDKLLNGFSKDVRAIDFREEMNTRMEQENNLYFYTDHHWKPKAAYYAYERIVNEMSGDFPQIGNPVKKDYFEWKEHPAPFYGSEARKTTEVNAAKADTITLVNPKNEKEPLTVCYGGSCDKTFYDLDVLEAKDVYSNKYVTYMSGDVPEGIIKNPNVKNGLKVLILKDSYANPMIQFMARSFEETRLLDLRKHDNLDVNQYVLENGIDAVVFVHNINSIVVTPAFLNL